MISIDVPNLSAPQSNQVALGSVVEKHNANPNFLLKSCQNVDVGAAATAGSTGIDPAWLISGYLDENTKRILSFDDYAWAKFKIKTLAGPKHGNLLKTQNDYGAVGIIYKPRPGYTGMDQAAFLVEFEGERYKVVVDLNVGVGLSSQGYFCRPNELIKTNGKITSLLSSGLNDNYTLKYVDIGESAVARAGGAQIKLSYIAFADVKTEPHKATLSEDAS